MSTTYTGCKHQILSDSEVVNWNKYCLFMASILFGNALFNRIFLRSRHITYF
jgi:hypothetical protein